MALPTTGSISISAVKAELGISNNDLRGLSAHLGKSTPDSLSEFYGVEGRISLKTYSASVSKNSGSITIIMTTGNRWSVSDNASWITVNSASGVGSRNFTVSYQTNTSTSARTGVITFSTARNSVSFTVNQAAGIPATITFPIALRKDISNALVACIRPKASYYITGPFNDFYAATGIFTNSSGTNKAGAGHYSDGSLVRYWNGNVFTGFEGLCLSPGGGPGDDPVFL